MGGPASPGRMRAWMALRRSPANLRQHFSRAAGVSPLSYRRTFRHRGVAA
jgi:hypothetical protein